MTEKKYVKITSRDPVIKNWLIKQKNQKTSIKVLIQLAMAYEFPVTKRKLPEEIHVPPISTKTNDHYLLQLDEQDELSRDWLEQQLSATEYIRQLIYLDVSIKNGFYDSVETLFLAIQHFLPKTTTNPNPNYMVEKFDTTNETLYEKLNNLSTLPVKPKKPRGKYNHQTKKSQGQPEKRIETKNETNLTMAQQPIKQEAVAVQTTNETTFNPTYHQPFSTDFSTLSATGTEDMDPTKEDQERGDNIMALIMQKQREKRNRKE